MEDHDLQQMETCPHSNNQTKDTDREVLRQRLLRKTKKGPTMVTPAMEAT